MLRDSSTCLLKARREPLVQSKEKRQLTGDPSEKLYRMERRGGNTSSCVMPMSVSPSHPQEAPDLPRLSVALTLEEGGRTRLTYVRTNHLGHSTFSLTAHGAQFSEKSHSPFRTDQPHSSVPGHLSPLRCGTWPVKNPRRQSCILCRRNSETARAHYRVCFTGHCCF